MLTIEQRQAIALAGIFQASTLVDQLAHTGQIDSNAMEILIRATLETHPERFSAIYENELENLHLGIESMRRLFIRSPSSSWVMRYSLSLILLANKAQNNPSLLDKISQRMARIQNQAQYFGPMHETTLASLAELYQDTFSTLRYRIIVQGDPSLLKSPMMPERIRALLLSGIRFAFLWRQQGGRRWHLLLRRNRLSQALAQFNQHEA